MSTLLLLAGLPGSGKTTLARWLAECSEFVVVSRDTIRSAMFPRCRYTLAEKQAAFAGMKRAVEITLEGGTSVCTDGITFASESDRAEMLAIASRAGARSVLVWCDVPLAIAQKRVTTDTDTVFPDRDAATVAEVAERFAPVGPEALRLDMTLPPEAVGLTLLAHLSGNGR